jgi:CRISPR-associated protein Cas1
MNSLFVDKRGIELKVDSNALTVYQDKTRINTVPLAPLKRIFILGDVLLSASVLAKLGEYQIGVVVLYGYKAQPTLLMPTYTKDAQRRQAQYKTSIDPLLSLSYARLLVSQKIQGHVRLLQEMQQCHPQHRMLFNNALKRLEGILIKPLQQVSNVETLRGLEGAAAACYFETIAYALPPSLGFDGRNRRPPKDPFNALLSLGYALLHSEAVLAIYAAGLDPFIGFYHTPTHGRESLACDLVEPLRHEIDRLCWRLVAEKTLTIKDFSQDPKMCQLNKTGRVRFYQAYETLLGSLRKKMWQQMRDLGQLIEGKPFEFEAVLLSELEA